MKKVKSSEKNVFQLDLILFKVHLSSFLFFCVCREDKLVSKRVRSCSQHKESMTNFYLSEVRLTVKLNRQLIISSNLFS